jgi:hypothetical protein
MLWAIYWIDEDAAVWGVGETGASSCWRLAFVHLS